VFISRQRRSPRQRRSRGTLADILHVFTALADIDGRGYDLLTGGISQPADTRQGCQDRRVKAEATRSAMCEVAPEFFVVRRFMGLSYACA
jgi:hypothetical protein